MPGGESPDVLEELRGAGNTVLSHVLSLCPRAILKELGLQGKVSTNQISKKWDNLKRRFKVLLVKHTLV